MHRLRKYLSKKQRGACPLSAGLRASPRLRKQRIRTDFTPVQYSTLALAAALQGITVPQVIRQTIEQLCATQSQKEMI